jgi:cobalamin biosynthesis protein CobD/CbiB
MEITGSHIFLIILILAYFLDLIIGDISGISIALSTGILLRSMERGGNAFSTMYHDGKKHTSPNSGYPEAAMAGTKGCYLWVVVAITVVRWIGYVTVSAVR